MKLTFPKALEILFFSVKRNFTDNPDKQIIINSKNEGRSSVEIAKEIFSI